MLEEKEIPIKFLKNNSGLYVVDSRTLHTFLKIKTRFCDWIKRVLQKNESKINVDYFVFEKSSNNKRARKEYYLTIDTAKLICSNLHAENAYIYIVKFEESLNKTEPQKNIKESINEENLVKVENNQIITSSRKVAKTFGKEHKHLLRDIKSLIGGMSNFGQTHQMFFLTSYINEQNGQKYPEYYMNRDGFSLLVMGFTGKKALEWKLRYIQAFNSMEERLKHIETQQETPVQSTIPPEELHLRQQEVQAKKAEILLEIGSRTQIPEYRQLIDSYAGNIVIGKEVLPLPEVKRRTLYTATDIGKILGISANRIGKLANDNNLKTADNGKWFYDKSKYSNKEVESFRYYENAIEVFRKLIHNN